MYLFQFRDVAQPKLNAVAPQSETKSAGIFSISDKFGILRLS